MADDDRVAGEVFAKALASLPQTDGERRALIAQRLAVAAAAWRTDLAPAGYGNGELGWYEQSGQQGQLLARGYRGHGPDFTLYDRYGHVLHTWRGEAAAALNSLGREDQVAEPLDLDSVGA